MCKLLRERFTPFFVYFFQRISFKESMLLEQSARAVMLDNVK